MAYFDTSSIADYTASNGRMVDELERIWKETILMVIELLSQNFPEGNKPRKS
jgi:hypothetical protein